MASLSMGSWVCSGIGNHGPSASLSLLTGSTRMTTSVSLKMAANASTRSGLLHCSFVPSSALSTLSFSTSFSGKSHKFSILVLNFDVEMGKEKLTCFCRCVNWKFQLLFELVMWGYLLIPIGGS